MATTPIEMRSVQSITGDGSARRFNRSPLARARRTGRGPDPPGGAAGRRYRGRVTFRRTAVLLAAGLLVALPGGGTAAELRTSTPRDDAAHLGDDVRTEWWFVNAVDPDSGLAVAAAMGSRFPGMPPASVVFIYPPGGGEASTVGAPRLLTAPPSAARADVRLGEDRIWSPSPGVLRVRIGLERGLVFSGPSDGTVRVDLTYRATAPGFLAGPLRIPGGQWISWTVDQPTARVSGTVEADGRTHRLRDVPGYHDHNFGDFDLADPAHGGWDWSQVHLPGGRSLVTGIVRPADGTRDGVSVLSDATGRLGSARARDVTIRRADWADVDGHVYPRTLSLRASLSGGWEAQVRFTARRALPLLFTRDGESALVEIEARTSGRLLRDGRVVSRWSAAPAFYEYESTPVTRERDGAPGSVTGLARAALGAAAQLKTAIAPFSGRGPAD